MCFPLWRKPVQEVAHVLGIIQVERPIRPKSAAELHHIPGIEVSSGLRYHPPHGTAGGGRGNPAPESLVPINSPLHLNINLQGQSHETI